MSEVIEASNEIIEYRIYLGTEVNEESARKVLEDLHYCDSAYPNAVIDFVINSQGGSLPDGDAIYAELYALSTRGGGSHWVRTKVRGMAGSIASLIYQAGDERVGGTLDYFIFHEPLLTLDSEFITNVQDRLDYLAIWSERELDIFCSRAKVPRSEIAALIGPRDRTVFMDEAIALGLADKIA